MRLVPSFGSAVTGLLLATGLVSETASYANRTTGLVSSTGPYANSTSELTRGIATPVILPNTPKVISVTNTTLITKVLANQKLQGDLPTVQVKVRKTSCISTTVPAAVSCTTFKLNARQQTLLQPGEDYSCSSRYTSTYMCYADIWDKETFSGASMTYTDIHTKSGLLVKITQTSYQQASVTPSSTRLDQIEVIIDDALMDKIFTMAEQQCVMAGFLSHQGDVKRQVSNLLTCDPITDLPMPVQMQLQANIAHQMSQGFMLPAAWVQHWLLNGVTRNQINIALWSIMGVSVLEAISEMGHGLGYSIPVKLSNINAALTRLGVLKPTTTRTTTSSTSDGCQMCKTSGAACNVNPADPQGEDGVPPIWPFPTLSGVITTPLHFQCHQGVLHENSQTWCNCGKTRYVKYPMTYTTIYQGSTTVLTENCPYVTNPPPDYLRYYAPTNYPPVSDPLIVTAAPKNTFQCKIASSSREDWQKTWCACPDGKAYGMTKHVYGIDNGGSTSWTTDTCGYTAPPSSIWTVDTNAPAIATGEAAITGKLPHVGKPGSYMQPMNGKYQKYDSVHWNSRSATSIASKFCAQMSTSSKSFIGTDANTLELNHKYWNGQPTERSYPVPTDPVGYYPAWKKPKALKIRLTHDPNACNGSQKDTGCKFDFRDKERCEHWLLTAIDSVDTTAIYDWYEHHFTKPFGMDWVPRVRLSGDGIVWQIDQGKRCVEAPRGSKGFGVDHACFYRSYLEEP